MSSITRSSTPSLPHLHDRGRWPALVRNPALAVGRRLVAAALTGSTLLLSLPGLTPPANASTAVTFCNHINFEQCVQTTSPKMLDLRASQIPHDQASSIRVPEGLIVTVWSDIGYDGRCQQFTSNVSDLRGSFVGNDSISSFEVASTGRCGDRKRLDPATATIIGALIAAAATAAATTSNNLTTVLTSGRSKDPFAAVLTNNSPYAWTKVDGYGTPVHGELREAAKGYVPDLIGGGTSPNADTTAEESNNTGWALKSKNRGTEVLTVYYNDELQRYLSLYGKNPFSGAVEVGVSLDTKSWFEANASTKTDGKGQWMIDHIRNNASDSNTTRFAKNGVTKSVTIAASNDGTDVLTVKFQGATQVSRFDIGWSGKYPVPD